MYAHKGFDFSCISALYYQAFENAYNCLVWHQYAKMLNALPIKGTSYTEILDISKGKGIAIQEAIGYLDNDPFTRSFYVKYGSKKKNTSTVVQSHCMYASFGILMSNIRYQSPLLHFCDYFSNIAGFSDRFQMLSDQSYMAKCKDFSQYIVDSADFRNNASHGGTEVTLEQCKTDKKTVINDLEQVREQCIGLIQLLLYLLYGHKKSHDTCSK